RLAGPEPRARAQRLVRPELARRRPRALQVRVEVLLDDLDASLLRAHRARKARSRLPSASGGANPRSRAAASRNCAGSRRHERADERRLQRALTMDVEFDRLRRRDARELLSLENTS